MTTRGRGTLDLPFPLDGGGAVVGSADRFAARARARRRRVWTAWLLAAASVVVAGWVLLVSPWGTVRTVEVTGTDRIPAQDVHALVDPQTGRPLLLVDPGALEQQVRSLRLVADVRVSRAWPGALHVDVRERQPVAALPAEGGLSLVDREGVEVEVVARAPRTLPVVEVDLVTAGPQAVRSALDSLAVMPADLRAQVRRIGAASGDGVWFRLADGDTVVWGDASQPALKVAALDALRRQTARERRTLASDGNPTLAERPVTFDVSAPKAPSVQR